jgi:hypothetical protein
MWSDVSGLAPAVLGCLVRPSIARHCASAHERQGGHTFHLLVSIRQPPSHARCPRYASVAASRDGRRAAHAPVAFGRPCGEATDAAPTPFAQLAPHISTPRISMRTRAPHTALCLAQLSPWHARPFRVLEMQEDTSTSYSGGATRERHTSSSESTSMIKAYPQRSLLRSGNSTMSACSCSFGDIFFDISTCFAGWNTCESD